MSTIDDRAAALEKIFAGCSTAAVACSGGVDSMTLAFLAHRAMGRRATIFHAISPAVPPAATARVRAYAAKEGWNLRTIDAGEFTDEKYLANPANRCFFCKSNLYGTLATAAAGAQLFSGTNVDDLGDWRPGLEAARVHAVRHPFVEASITKADIRALAAANGLTDVAELPSAPCLSSRVESGIRIDAATLRAIDRLETLIRDRHRPGTVRCRIRSDGLVIELDDDTLARLPEPARQELIAAARTGFALAPTAAVEFASYRRGSAFLRATLS